MQPIRIFDIIARRRIMIFGVVLVLIFGTAVGLAANFFANSKKAHADSYTLGDGGYIGPNDASRDWANTDVTVTASSTNPAAIDGKHTFNNLTVQGTLTTSDYNHYGVDGMYYEESLAGARDAKSLAPLTGTQYLFIMRGFINTKGTHKTYYLTSETDGNLTTHPDSFRVLDSAVVRFFPAVSASTEKSADLFSNEVGYAMTNAGSIYDGTFAWYTDGLIPSVQTTVDNPILPFELVYVNDRDEQYFGISTCSVACNTVIGNHTFVKSVSNGTALGSMTEGTAQTYQAWQGDRADSSVRSDKTTIFDKDWWISKDDLISGINVHKQNNLYRDYYFADGYNFNEPKVFLQNDKHMLDTPTTVAMTGDELRQFSPVVGGATYMFFLPHFSWQVTPLAIRHDVDSGYPIISESLFRTMHQLQSTVNKKTEITISGTLTVLSGGRINVNGKGFAPSLFTSGTQINYGAGPAAGWGGYHQTTPAGSHAGFGGYQTDISVLYDSALLNEPILPGSAGGYSAMDMNCAYATSSYGGFGGPYDRVCHRGIDNYESFGGGFISISAKSVNLASGSAVTANAVGGNTDHPAPGGAGGSIILKDADSGSQYGGAIEAMGAGIREASGDSHARTNSGGGGGGNIYIATSVAPTSTLTSAENTVIAPAIQLDNWFWDNRPAADFASLKISVSGGDTETGIKGSPGIINIVGSQPPMAGIHKIIDKIEPLDGTSPYNLKPADKIRITLHVTNLVVGQPITIRDEFFNDGTVAGISKFSLIVGSNDCKTHIGGGSVDLSSCTMTPTTSDIAWTFTPAAGQETVDLQYSLLVK